MALNTGDAMARIFEETRRRAVTSSLGEMWVLSLSARWTSPFWIDVVLSNLGLGLGEIVIRTLQGHSHLSKYLQKDQTICQNSRREDNERVAGMMRLV